MTDEEKKDREASERAAMVRDRAQYRDLPYDVTPNGVQLQVAPIDAKAAGFIWTDPERKILAPEKQKRLDFFEVLAAGPGFQSPYATVRVENPYKAGEFILADPDDVRVATHGDKKIAMVDAGKVLARVNPKK
jgi:hypothetical protein